MHVYRVGLWLVVASLIPVFAPVHAEWVALEDRYQLHPLQTAYVDPGTIHREGHLVTLSTLIDWKAMQEWRSPPRFYSTKLSKQFDCKERITLFGIEAMADEATLIVPDLPRCSAQPER